MDLLMEKITVNVHADNIYREEESRNSFQKMAH